MNTRWQKSLLAAADQYDTPVGWERGNTRQMMIARLKDDITTNTPALQARSA